MNNVYKLHNTHHSLQGSRPPPSDNHCGHHTVASCGGTPAHPPLAGSKPSHPRHKLAPRRRRRRRRPTKGVWSPDSVPTSAA